MERLQLLIAIFSLLCFLTSLGLLVHIAKLHAVSKNSERILQRILEIINQTANERKASKQMTVNRRGLNETFSPPD